MYCSSARVRRGTWELLINGLRPFKYTLFSARLSEAEAAAYSSADRYFVEKGIVDPRVPRKEIAWVAHP
jgi:hypothetical protein